MSYVIQGGRLSDSNDQRALEDAELLRQAQAGDGEAFGVLYERYAPNIHRTCMRTWAIVWMPKI